MKSSSLILKLFLLVGVIASYVHAFAPSIRVPPASIQSSCIYAEAASATADPKEIIGKTITVKGDVNGGYVRTCIVNEVSSSIDWLIQQCITLKIQPSVALTHNVILCHVT